MGSGASTLPSNQVLSYPNAHLKTYEKGRHWKMERDAEGDLKLPATGTFSTFEHYRISDLLETAASRDGNKPALSAEIPVPILDVDGKPPPPLPAEEWTTWTWNSFRDDAQKIGKAYMHHGVEQFDSVSVFGPNCPYWVISVYAASYAGGKTAGVYPTDTPEQLQFKAFHSDSSAIMIEGDDQLKKVEVVIDQLPFLKLIIAWAGASKTEIVRADGTKVPILTWAQALEVGGKVTDAELKARTDLVKPGHAAVLVYTSGTTGDPKAVMLTHMNLIFNSKSAMEGSSEKLRNIPHYKCLSYLPLSHIAGASADIFMPSYFGAYMPGNATVYFTRPYDLKLGSLVDRLKFVRPTMFLGVPRVYEKFEEKIRAKGAESKGLKKKVVKWAKGKTSEAANNRHIGGSFKKPMMYDTADKLMAKAREALGLDQVLSFITGAAPLKLETQNFFAALGMNICEVYGMSENTGSTTWSTDESFKWGTCGCEAPGVEVKVFRVDELDASIKTECPRAVDCYSATEAEQGEICFRGPHIMMGYLSNPKLGDDHVAAIIKKNDEAIDSDGWLHSGDKGCKDTLGFVKITGRYKELIITAGGENIAPVPIEDTLKKHLPGISNAVMIGDKRKFNIVVLTLQTGGTGELPGGQDLEGTALAVNPETKTISAAMKDPKWIEAITDAFKKTNADGKCCPSNAAKVQKFTILPLDFSVTTGEFTATLKLKRGEVTKKYGEFIDKMYESKEMYVPYEP